MRGVPLLAAAMLIVALALPASAAAESVPAHSAADFRDSIGVQTHVSYYDTVYGDWPRLVEKLDDLGVDHLRDGTFANPDWGDWNERYYQAVELAAAHGKRFLLNMGRPNYGAGTLDQLADVLGGRLRHAVVGIEGANEYDLFHAGPNWADELREHQTEMYRRVKSDPRLRDLPVIGPSLVYGDPEGKLGSLANVADVGNFHPYAGGQAPSQQHLRERLGVMRPVFGDRPFFATEAGFHNALAASEGQPAVHEEVVASYLLRTYLEHFRAGIRRTYVYELVDEMRDNEWDDPEQHFGLLRNDLSEKPAFAALRAMLRVLGRPGPVAPQPLDIGIEGDTHGVQRLLLQRGDGRYTLVMWQSASEWDTVLQRTLPVSKRSVSLSLPADAEVGVARPARGGEAVRSVGRTRVAEIAVPADPVLVELDFGGPAAGPAPDPVALPEPDPGAPPTAEPKCALPTGGVRMRRPGASARISTRASRTRPVKVGFCAKTAGSVAIELGRAGRGGRLEKVLASSSLVVTGGRSETVAPRWTKRARARLGGGRPAVRVRFRPEGARHEVVLSRGLDVRAVRRR